MAKDQQKKWLNTSLKTLDLDLVNCLQPGSQDFCNQEVSNGFTGVGQVCPLHVKCRLANKVSLPRKSWPPLPLS